MTTSNLRSRLEVMRGIVEEHATMYRTSFPYIFQPYLALALKELEEADRLINLANENRAAGAYEMTITYTENEACSIITRFERHFGTGEK